MTYEIYTPSGLQTSRKRSRFRQGGSTKRQGQPTADDAALLPAALKVQARLAEVAWKRESLRDLRNNALRVGDLMAEAVELLVGPDAQLDTQTLAEYESRAREVVLQCTKERGQFRVFAGANPQVAAGRGDVPGSTTALLRCSFAAGLGHEEAHATVNHTARRRAER